ncbi:MAG: glycosyltransferase family 4 protein [Paracoccaceae bacterium]
MQIAFYAPLKSPEHPVPSGDRLMAGMLRGALQAAGHGVTLVSELRSYCGDPENLALAAQIIAAAGAERRRIAEGWRAARAPDLWVCYHPYYKSPDLIGPDLCRSFGVPYVTIEASLSARRNLGVWVDSQVVVAEAVEQAAVNICLTARDRAGILQMAPGAVVADLPPFIDATPFLGARQAGSGAARLVTVAMMREGDKLASYRMLAEALAALPGGTWQLTIVGSGVAEVEVRGLFAPFGRAVVWAGLLDRTGVAAALLQSDLYVWPGFGEAYGLAYLEAQASGLPVVAQAVAGVPEVVKDGVTGFLTPEGDVAGYAAAVGRLIGDAGLRAQMGQAARARVLAQHASPAAVARLDHILTDVVEARR